ncbi:MAG: signal peptide peptidase SppA [Phycisphaerae bacterium]
MSNSRLGRAVSVLLTVFVSASAVLSAPDAKTPQGGPKKREPAVKQKVELKEKTAEKEAQPRVAHIRVDGTVLASPPDFSWLVGQTPGMTLREWVQRLATARNDERIRAVALELDGPLMNWSQAQELADAVSRLNKTKPVYAHVTSASALQYLVASAAREVTMDPAGTLAITGLGAELTFFKGTLDWVGIEAQMIQIGRYKGAAEPFTRKGPSEELKSEYDKILDDLYAQLCGQFAQQRRLTVPHVRHVIDSGPIGAQDAREYRFVDHLVSKADWQDHVVAKVRGTKQKSADWLADYARKKAKPMDFSNPLALFSMMFAGGPAEKVRDPAIAIIHADGVIVSGKSGQSLFGARMVGSKTMLKCFRQAAEDEKVKAVVFRVNSPGGSAMASELIYQAARKCAAKKPVIVSISGMGASGGYYVALGGRQILADPAAIVGSVGVVGGKLALSGLLEKVGISTYEITRGRNAGLWMSRPWDEREQDVIRRMSTRTYDRFVSVVKSSRGRRVKDVAAVTAGRVFTARQAVKNGLIDGVGGIREAVMAAQSAAKLKRSYIITLPRPKTLMDVLYGGQWSASPLGQAGTLERLVGGGASPFSARSGRHAALGYMLSLAQMLDRETVLTAMPYHVSLSP